MRKKLNKLVLAVILIAVASTTNVSGMEEPVVDSGVMIEEVTAGSSAGNLIIPLLAVLLLAATVEN